MKFTNFIWITIGLVGVILAEESNYSYWRPEASADFDEDAFQSLQSIERQDFEDLPKPAPIAGFGNGIRRQFELGSPAVSIFYAIKRNELGQCFALCSTVVH